MSLEQVTVAARSVEQHTIEKNKQKQMENIFEKNFIQPGKSNNLIYYFEFATSETLLTAIIQRIFDHFNFIIKLYINLNTK